MLYDLSIKTFFVSRDVIFKESVFPFSSIHTEQSKAPFLNALDNTEIMCEIAHHLPYVHPTDSHDAADSSPTYHNMQFPDEDMTNNLQDEALVLVPERHDIVEAEPNLVTHIFPTLRWSTRESHPPIWIKDFVSLNINKEVKYPISANVAYDHLFDSYKAYIVATSSLVEPTTYDEAVKDSRWIDAM